MSSFAFEDPDRGIRGDITITLDELEFSIGDDGDVVDATVYGTHRTARSGNHGEQSLPLGHVEGSFLDERLYLVFRSSPGAPVLADWVLRMDSSPGRP
ncbi:MAG: hypothetical protein AAF500_18890 [Myxococcota bacterium]